jgi:hypothetical protein
LTDWTVDALAIFFQRQLDDLRSMLNERYGTQTKAVDAAFLAQQTAMQTALTAADRAVQAALQSAKEAVTKAETAANDRFVLLNELRSGVATTEQLEGVEKQIVALDKRLTLREGHREGGQQQIIDRRAQVASVVAVVLLILTVVAFVIARTSGSG